MKREQTCAFGTGGASFVGSILPSKNRENVIAILENVLTENSSKWRAVPKELVTAD
jgi:hypothetical protein